MEVKGSIAGGEIVLRQHRSYAGEEDRRGADIMLWHQVPRKIV